MSNKLTPNKLVSNNSIIEFISNISFNNSLFEENKGKIHAIINSCSDNNRTVVRKVNSTEGTKQEFEDEDEGELNLYEQPSIFVSSQNSQTISMPINIKSNKLFENELANEFLEIMTDDCFESGYISNSEKFVLKLLNEDPLRTKEWLNTLFIDYYCDECFLVGLLHIISHIDYHLVYPQAQTMALAGLNHRSTEVRECSVMAFETWANIDSLKILKNVKCSEKWLQDYIDQVIYDLEEELLEHGLSS